jgi:two-component system OmpR family response regulator
MKEKLIFIVEDDEMMSEMLRDYISNNSMNKVLAFGTGEECLQNLNQNPDVIILDYNLNMVVPDAANGLEILEQIKKIDNNICVVMLSSQEQYGKALQTIAKGAIEYVVKDSEAFNKIGRILNSLK